MVAMKVNVKFVNDEVKDLYLKASGGKTSFPFKTHESDFCYDVVAVSCQMVAPNVYKYGIGLAFQIERERSEVLAARDGLCYEYLNLHESPINLSIDFRPRSSVWETGMVLSNCEGTIDEEYTGEVSAVFYHLFPDMPRYNIGDRIGQIKVGTTFPIEFEEVAEHNTTARGANGYGSTGK